MVSLRYLSPLLLALSLAARPSQAQQTDLTPLQPVRPQLLWPDTPNRGAVHAYALTATETPVDRRCISSILPPLPLLVVNSKLLTAYGYLSKLNPSNITKVAIYKGGNHSPATMPAQWRGLDVNGIIVLTLKKKVRLKSQTLAQLGRHLQAQRPVRYTINGLPTANSTLRIATTSIAEIKLTRTLAGTTVGVWLLQEPDQPTRTYPPGTILIRGTASR